MFVEVRKARVVRLSAVVTIKDLLEYDREFEDGKHLVESDVRQIRSGSCRVLLEDLIACKPAGPARY